MNLGKNSELNYILGGDLNARTKQIGCVRENENGIMLERIINDVLNSQDMTSDHFPIEASISMGYQLENKSAAKRTKKGSNLIPNLILNENEFKTNEEKGKCFGELLSSIFSPNSDLIDSEKDIEILNSNSDFFRNYNQSNFNDAICLNELIMALKRLKNEAASGPDQIHNLIEGRVSKAWIQKKASSLQDPLNYRPISYWNE
ncbi:hypothetical protein BpHYR1_007631 [Brachionus plicatilis]|uniref:RNA-directed DNA polymerase from mobile element jockey-like n=1 Tax=Brachionus plicatilis TaxID=10195 RepID=A0A3M7RCR0_BRAPC|nr:hypothetical protein BpHYR1_007631 [Brachionus plicatilis]